MFPKTHAIIFDLDGTLYVNDDFAREIKRGAAAYISRLKGIPADSASSLIRETREDLSRKNGEEATLSAVCSELGGSVAGFHATVTPLIHPEKFLKPDHRVTSFIAELAGQFSLYIYTNNNRTLTDEILEAIGLSGFFESIFTIEDFWKPKPDRSVLKRILSGIKKNPDECLFVGDRLDVDLKAPAEMGCSTFLIENIEGLLELRSLLPQVNR